jgi:hypothetical protein
LLSWTSLKHLLFLHKLGSEYDFHTSDRSMVSSFLQDRSIMVEVDGVKSSPRSLFSGVPIMLMICIFIYLGIKRI